jgi:hypothetical protein
MAPSKLGPTTWGVLSLATAGLVATLTSTSCGDDAASSGAGGSGAGGGDATGAGGEGGELVLPDPLGPIAPITPTSTERFETSRACNQCHYAGTSDVMHDPVTGEDLSPGYQWQSSMMAFAARDPYYLAVVSEELRHAGDAAPAVEATCLRCHAPAGSEEVRDSEVHLSLDELLTGTSPAANLGRDGVACALCHQIEDDGLGTAASFTGGFSVGYERRIYGPHAGPNTQPMEFFLDYTPTYSEHIVESSLCATCHTVVTPVIDEDGDDVGDFVEQAPFLEWENSVHVGSRPCSTCHMPSTDSAGDSIATPIATYPDDLLPRSRYGIHSFVGANAYMLDVLGDNVAWTGSSVPAEELFAAAERSREHLATAASLIVGSPRSEGGDLVVDVTVNNQTGHKLPTGYPGRRMWIHLRALGAGGSVVLEIGRWDAEGRILGADGAPLDGDGVLLPHRDEVGPGEVQVWESVPGDLEGAPTHRPLAAASYLKDDRILPTGWSSGGPWSEWTSPVGTSGDASFTSGSDRVSFRIPNGASVERVEATLVYQTLPPAVADHLRRVPTPAAVRFTQMVDARPSEVVPIATASRDL